MESLFYFLNQGWVGLLIGTGLALYQLFKKSAPKPVYQYSGQKLISSEGGLLPHEISVHFKGDIIPRVSLTYIIFWNQGGLTIKGEDIASNAPLIFTFGEGEILKAEVIKSSRVAIGVNIDTQNKSQLKIDFSFLDASDGFLLQVIHTNNSIIPSFDGAIMGVPKGVKCLGRSIHDKIYSRKLDNNIFLKTLKNPIFNKFFVTVMFIVGVLLITSSVYPYFSFQNYYLIVESSNKSAARVLNGILGIGYTITAVYMWLRMRRRYPNTISIDNI